jgi:hypothetical protein
MICMNTQMLKIQGTGVNSERKLLGTHNCNLWLGLDRPIIYLSVIITLLRLKRKQSKQ